MSMNKILIIGLLLVFTVSLSAQQTVKELTNNCASFVDKKQYSPEQVVPAHDDEGNHCDMESYILGYIFNLQVVPYFNIKGYDTELKREMFKETTEYKEYEKKLIQIKNDVKNRSFYYISKLKRNEYNLSKGSFLYEIELYEGRYVDFPGYINLGTICIEYATKRFPKNKIEIIKRFGGRDYFYKQRIYLPVKDKRVALKVEEGGNQVGVLFKFKIDSVKRKRILFSENDFVLTKTEGIYLINIQTGEVYCKVL